MSVKNDRTRTMPSNEIGELARQVQHNCHISDARHGANYSMCIYLMKMREYFRWEKGFGYADRLPKDEVGPWLAERESAWAEMEELEYQQLDFGEASHDPFESELLNAGLTDQGYVYSAGLGYQGAAHFFLAERESSERHHSSDGDYTIHLSGKELARDLTSPPAMSRGRDIYLRRESFRRMLWERIESWRWNKPDNAMGRALACYDFDTQLDASLDEMTDVELQMALLHEIGEIRAGELLDNTAWRDMVHAFQSTPAELIARSIRDHLADAVSTLPALLDEHREASIHFYLGNMTNMRKHLFPRLEQGYEQWLKQPQDLSALREALSASQAHWLGLANRLLNSYQQHGLEAIEIATEMVDNQRL